MTIGGLSARHAHRVVVCRLPARSRSFLTADKGALFEPIHLARQMDGVAVEISLKWCSESYSDTLLGYANR